MSKDDLTAHAMQYLAVTDAMGYEPGPFLLSPEEYATELRKNAARYLWIRDEEGAHSIFTALYFNTQTSEQLNAAIDAAMAADAKENS